MAEPLIPYDGASVLNKYFPRVQELQGYLADIMQSPGAGPHEQDLNHHEGFSDFLNTTYVATSDVDHQSKFEHVPPELEMREVLDQAQLRLLKSRRPQNIITAGYRLASFYGDNGKYGGGRPGITNYFVNTVVTAFQAPEWEMLLRRIGVDAMIHLLTQTSIFVSLPNGSLCQLAGEPLIHAIPQVNDIKASRVTCKHPLSETDTEQKSRKRRKLESSTNARPQSNTLGTSFPPAKINFIRVRLFYSRPSFVPHSNHMVVGLPLQHVLNRIQPPYLKSGKAKSNTVDASDARQKADQARHLSKYIFARQYGLSNPFHSRTSKSSAFSFGDYMDREPEIKAKGPCKTPKRLKEIQPMLERLILRHGRCGYMPLRDIACPSKVNSTGVKDLDNSIILELMSETSIQLRTQIPSASGNVSVDSNGNSIMALGNTQAQKYAKQKPRFVEFACSHQEVFRFVVLVTNAVIPKSFWGSKANLKLVLRYVKEFIDCRRHETLNLHYILQNFSTTACDWLSPSSHQDRVSVSDSLKRRELLEDFLFWYFDSFVMPLLRTTFYVTDSSAFRNQILYFRHDDWALLCAPLIDRLTSTTFEKLTDEEAAQILRQRKLGFSFVRLLPKETGVRPIVNLRRKETTGRSINQVLQAAFAILGYERTSRPERLGASIFGPDDIYFKLKEFKTSLPQDANNALPKLYFVKVDVQACFDTIEQTKLLQILRELISEDRYMIQKYGQIKVSAGKIKRTYVKKAFPEDDHPHFLRQAADLANVLRNTIFVDQVVYTLSQRQEVLELLEEHITENIVKIGRNYYRQVVGIPQGSILSSILCSFFYGDLEKRFRKFREDSHSVLLRLIDDYLYISTSKELASEFLETMKKGHPEYGCFIAQDKTLTNFEHGDNVLNVVDPTQRTFPWCGYSINMRDLSITVDYTRYQAYGIRSTMTVDKGRRPGAAFTYKLLQLAQAKSHPIFSDMDLNPEHIVYLNIYQNLLMTAMKMHEYIRDWAPKKRCDGSFLRNIVQQAILYSYTTVRAQARRKRANSEINKDVVLWLGYHAFHHILSKVPKKYKTLLAYLSLELRRARYRQYRRRFKAMLKEGQAGVSKIPR